MNSIFDVPKSGEKISDKHYGMEYCKFLDECLFRNKKNNVIGYGDIFEDNSTASIELDLRSEKLEERTIRFIIKDKQQECFFYDAPLSVKVCLFNNIRIIEITSVLKMRERVTKGLKWEEGYDWDGNVTEEDDLKKNSGYCSIC